MGASPTPSSDEQYAVGSVLDGRYRVEALLGTGGMGRVYRAEHIKIGRTVALKVLHADLGRNREASQRFQREAIASGRLDHPNIVGVSDFGVLDDGACYLVMEVLEGESLGERLVRDQRIHWVEAIEILRGVLHGLRHAHERGVVHRDIKPDNVYLARKDGETVVKILDFGIAKLYAGSADDPAQTRAGLTVGTPAYLSPEQAVGGEITPRSDLYSASVVLYEMVAGRAPFEDKDPLAMLGAHVSRRPPRFADIAPGVEIPAPLEDIVQHGLRKSAAERITTAAEYVAMLDAFCPPLRPRLATLSGVDSGPHPTWDRPRGDAVDPAGSRDAGPMAGMPAQGKSRAAVSGTEVRGSLASPLAPRSQIGPATSGRPSAATPAPATTGSLAAAASLEIAPLPRATRAVSLADVSEPIPLTWIVRSGVVIGLVIIAAVVLAIAARCGGAEPRTPSSASGSSAAQPARVPATPASGDPARPSDPAAGSAQPGDRRPQRGPRGRGRE